MGTHDINIYVLFKSPYIHVACVDILCTKYTRAHFSQTHHTVLQRASRMDPITRALCNKMPSNTKTLVSLPSMYEPSNHHYLKRYISLANNAGQQRFVPLMLCCLRRDPSAGNVYRHRTQIHLLYTPN